jgi:hypothetical protein
MTKILTSLLLLLGFTQYTAAQSLIPYVNIGLIYPLSTNGIRAWNCNNYFSINAVASVSASENAFCAAGVANVVRDSANGFIAAGVVNVVNGNVNGLQMAGVVNVAKNVTGAQFAGLLNVAGNVSGTQFSGLANVTYATVYGAQFAGFTNKARNVYAQYAGFSNAALNVNGMQAAGFSNNATGNVNGLQMAGFSNQAVNTTAQLAGFINKADVVQGMQVAGFINVARQVKGVQVAGFMNIADSSDYPIGLVNLIKKGEKAIGVSVDETGTTMATFRSGGRIMYGMVGAGINNYKSNGLYAVGAGIGAHLPFSRHFRGNIEAVVNTLTGFDGRYFFSAGFRLFPSVKIARVELFGGPSVNFATYTRSLDILPHHTAIWTDRYYNYKYDVHVGVTAGLQLHI